MELWQQMLCVLLEGGAMEIRLPQLEEVEKILERRCYRALLEIKRVIEDDSLDDPSCFWKIEEILRIYEKMGSDGGSRHDF